MSFLIGGKISDGAQLSFGASQEAIVLMMIVLALALLGLFWTRRQTNHQYLWIEMGLWLCSAVVLGFALSQPTLTSDSGRMDDGRFVVLIDRSASMGAIEDGRPRSDRVSVILGKICSDRPRTSKCTTSTQLHVGLPANYSGMESDLVVH